MINNNCIFYERLLQAIKQTGKSVNQIERELGYPRNSLHNYRNHTEPSGIRLIELSQYFQVSPAYLIGKTQNNSCIDLKNFFHHLNDEEKLKVLNLSQEWVYRKIIKKKYRK